MKDKGMQGKASREKEKQGNPRKIKEKQTKRHEN